MKSSVATFSLSLVAGAVLGVTCLGQEPEWHAIEREVTAQLWASNTPMVRLVLEVNTGPVVDGAVAMRKLCVFMRAGMNEEACLALKEVQKACPNLDSSQLSAIYYYACDREESWDVAQVLVELYAERVADLSLESRLLKHWLASGRTPEQIDQWFAARPKGIDSFWVKERLRFAQSHGQGQALLKQLSDEVRRNPRDVTNALVFLDGALSAGPNARGDLSWFEDCVKPERALEAKAVAERLQHLGSWRAALSYFQQAIALPLSDTELQELGRRRQAMTTPEKLRTELAVISREAMAECLLKLGQPEAAQQKMIEAANLREKNQIGPNALLAGRVQAQSAQHTVERRIVETEKKSESDLEYWRERASFFRGQQQFQQEEQALKKVLALTAPQDRPKHPAKGQADPRASALSDYAQFLARHGRDQEAAALLREEMAQAPPTTVSSERAAWLLAFDFHKHVSAQYDVLWSWLATRPEWGNTEERLLWRMLEKAPPNGLDQNFKRAEELASAGFPSRAFTLGWLLNRMRFAERSIPWLKSAVEKTTDAEMKGRAAFTLLESYLDTGEWHEAESVFPEAMSQLTSSELPSWHSRVAILAAKGGAKADALRLWRRTANLAPTYLGGLIELAELGLRDDLVAFYQAMGKELPTSHAPAKALRLIKLPRNRKRVGVEPRHSRTLRLQVRADLGPVSAAGSFGFHPIHQPVRLFHPSCTPSAFCFAETAVSQYRTTSRC